MDLSQTAMQLPYDPTFFRHLFSVEDRHFWFRTRNRIIAALAGEITNSLEPGYRVLEVGCGTGSILCALEQACTRGTVIGLDILSEGLQYARQRTRCSLVQADSHSLPFANRLDLIGLFDVLEHQQDDEGLLMSLRTHLTPAGTLLLTVPAHPSLWSYWDEACHHYRRYRPSELEEKLKKAGYRVEYLTQFMASLFPVMWLSRRLAGWFGRGRADDAARAQQVAARELRIIPVINELMGWLLSLELGWIARRRRLPIGTSLLAIAHKAS